MANKNAKSFTSTVLSGGRGVSVKKTHFLPGYTSLHKATERESMEAYIEARKAEIESIQAKIDLVQEVMENGVE